MLNYNTYYLDKNVGWGREITIHTKIGSYVGSGRGYHYSDSNIRLIKPTIEELQKGVTGVGFSSRQQIQSGEYLVYVTDQGVPFKLKFKDVEYWRDPVDQFHCKFKLVDERPFIEKVKRFFLWPKL